MQNTPMWPPASRTRDDSILIGCLPLAAGLILGLTTVTVASEIIGDSWAYCMNMGWGEALDIADSSRTSLIGTGALVIVADVCSFPVGFHVAWRLARAERLRIRVVAGVAAGLLLLGGAFGTDLVLNVGPEGGKYVHALCPGGRPPWWPGWLPLLTTPSPVDFKDWG